MGNLTLIDGILSLCDFNDCHNALTFDANTLQQDREDGIYLPLAWHHFLKLKEPLPRLLRAYTYKHGHHSFVFIKRSNIFSENGHEGYIEQDNNLFYFNGDSSKKIKLTLNSLHQITLIGDVLYLFQEGKMSTWQNGIRTVVNQDRLTKYLSYYAGGAPNFQLIKSLGKDYLVERDSLFELRNFQGQIIPKLLTAAVKASNISSILYDSSMNLLMVGSFTDGLFIYKPKPMQVMRYEPLANEPQINSLYALQLLSDSVVLTPRGSIKLDGPNIPITFPWNRYCLVKLNDSLFLTNEMLEILLNDATLKRGKEISGFPKGILACGVPSYDFFYIGLKDRIVKIKVINNNINILKSWKFEHKGLLSSLAVGADSTIIIGSDLGIYSLSEKTQKFTTLSDKIQNVRSLYRASNGTIFIGTYGLGWYLWQQNQFYTLPLDSKLSLRYAHTFAEDKSGFIWVSTNNGLFRFLLKEAMEAALTGSKLFYNQFDKSYGALTTEYNGGGYPAVQVTSTGQMIFASLDGLVTFDPNSMILEEPKFPILIDEVLVDGKALPTNHSINPNFNAIKVQITTPYYGNPYNLNIDYRLNGNDDSWTPIPEDGIITFNRLQAGTYKLAIRKANGFGSNSNEVQELKFEVLPYWYHRTIFYIALALLLVLATLSLLWQRFRRLNQQKANLESMVNLRTEELSHSLEALEKTIDELNDSQDALEKNIHFREQITSAVLHDIRSPLSFIDKALLEIHESIKNNSLEKEKLLNISQTVQGISSYSNELLTWINQNDAQDNSYTTKPLCDTLLDIVDRYRPIANAKSIKLNLSCKYDEALGIQQNLVTIIVRNLIDNAIKNTNSGTITLQFSASERGVGIEVTDTGVGMSSEKMEQLLSPKIDIYSHVNGFGYHLIRSFVNKLSGHLAIESQVGIGTKVRITIPLKREYRK